MRLELVERILDFPPLVIECREITRRSALRIENGRDQAVVPYN
jgi:hypothetical protein